MIQAPFRELFDGPLRSDGEGMAGDPAAFAQQAARRSQG